MKTIVIRLIVATALFAAGAACRAEARWTRQVAEAYARFATLHYDVEEGAGGAMDTASAGAAGGNPGPSWLSRLPLPIPSLAGEVRDRQTAARYWRADYRSLQPAADASTGQTGAADPTRMFVSANAAFREAQAEQANRTAAVARLDNVIQSYTEVLRADPANTDAAYNFEYAVRFRDRLAAARPARGRTQQAPPPEPVIPSVDLPTGPTIHGRPGAPPPEVPGGEFRTLAPMPYEEREETDPGVGVTPRRRG